jgi:nucleotide-binding universal stress UspA family protein
LLIKKILLPVDFPPTSVSIIQQAVTLAEHFHAEIVMLHVATLESQAAGVPASEHDLARWNLLAEILHSPEQNFGESLRAKLETLAVRGIVVQGEPARAILQTAQSEDADVIMMASHGPAFDQFLLGSVTARVLRFKECPVWTGAHRQEKPSTAFTIKNILCAVELGRRSQQAASWAAQLAAEFGARLTLCNVTESVAIAAPGGSWVNPRYQQRIVDDASHRLRELQKDLSIKADLLIGSGGIPKVLSEMASQTEADLLVLDCYPYSGNLRLHGNAIIFTVPVPVLSV